MRASLPAADVALIARQIEATAGIDRVRAKSPTFAAATTDTIIAILNEAARFADEWLGPFNDIADAKGCRLQANRVVTAPGHCAAWDAFVAAGWPTLDQPEAVGGQELPLAVAMAVQEVFDRSCPAFGMLPVPQRSAARLISAHGDAAIRDEWLPRLVAGEWGATICISEADAGSDVGRIRTRAVPNTDGSWSITGEKTWISFGDHDLTRRIGHCLLARTPGAADGGRGLSLFVVPDTLDDGARNAVHVRRIEHKLGLHGSPTCVLEFDSARGHMLGSEGRGLAQMFVMITNMRLSVGVQGLGIASSAADIAAQYAAERVQGSTDETPATIDAHADVQLMLLDMMARVDTLRGLILSLAVIADLTAEDPQARALTQWLLPIVKTAGGEAAFEVASTAIQVLGGAGYTREWPVEQALRDARVLTIFEGTTGIQALDLVERRLLSGDAAGYRAFIDAAVATAIACAGEPGRAFGAALATFKETSDTLMAGYARDAHAGATAYLRFAILIAMGWIAARNVGLHGDDNATRRLVVTGTHWLTDIEARSKLLQIQALTGSTRLKGFHAIKSTQSYFT